MEQYRYGNQCDVIEASGQGKDFDSLLHKKNQKPKRLRPSVCPLVSFSVTRERV